MAARSGGRYIRGIKILGAPDAARVGMEKGNRISSSLSERSKMRRASRKQTAQGDQLARSPYNPRL